MAKLLFYKIKHTVTAHKFLTLIITLSITASFFCVNTLFGYAEDLYRSGYDSTWYSTICVRSPEDVDLDEVKALITDEYGFEIGSALCFTKLEDENIFLIGFEGTDRGSQWFPEISGTFFTDDEELFLSDNAYLSQSVCSSIGYDDKIVIDGAAFNVIGYGWIISLNFSYSMGDELYSSFFSSENSSYETEKDFAVIPETSYEKYGYKPELVLIHVNDATYKQLEGIVSSLRRIFPDAGLTVPEYNSDNYKIDTKLGMMPIGAVFVVLIGTSLVSLLYAWLDDTRRISHIYVICGISKAKIMIISQIELLLFVLLGEALALLIQYISLPWLSYLGDAYMPEASDVFLSFAVLCAAVTAILFRKIFVNLKIERSVLS
ncbi:MAG: hypothetical protein LUI15_07645 [Firmicutes bacterium]|nr:hypothetical protein [Bacillota bacterium]